MSGRGIAVGVVNAYRRWISPLFPSVCRFHPSCSAYARDAFTIHGVWRGGMLTGWRLMRCQPFNRGGFDPVPPRSRPAGRVVG